MQFYKISRIKSFDSFLMSFVMVFFIFSLVLFHPQLSAWNKLWLILDPQETITLNFETNLNTAYKIMIGVRLQYKWGRAKFSLIYKLYSQLKPVDI